jgi:hypothetical protein
MSLKRSTRSPLALITALLLLLCQTAFAAQACARSFANAQGDAPPACDESAGHAQDHRKSSSTAADVCPSGKAIGAAAKVEVHSLTELPAITVSYSDAIAVVTASATPAVPAFCHSPPLTVLHCRFLN